MCRLLRRPEAEPVYVPVDGALDMGFIFARREERKMDHGGTISWKDRSWAPVGRGHAELACVKVEVRQSPSGQVWVVHKGQRIEMEEVEKPKELFKERGASKPEEEREPVKANEPAPEHIWKRPPIGRSGYGHPTVSARHHQGAAGVTLSLHT